MKFAGWARWLVIGSISLTVDMAMYARNPVLRDFVNGQAWIYYLYLSAMTGVTCWVFAVLFSWVLGQVAERRGYSGQTKRQ